MSLHKNQLIAIMLFILGLFLLFISFQLWNITETVTRYRDYMGFSIPYQVEIHPHETESGSIAFFGIIFILSSFILIATTVFSKPSETPENHRDPGWPHKYRQTNVSSFYIF